MKSLKLAMFQYKRAYVLAAFLGNDSRVMATARALGVNRVTMYRLLRRLEIPWLRQSGAPRADRA
jgi:transcriptional regulator of acetoin/glycerol metabolism